MDTTVARVDQLSALARHIYQEVQRQGPLDHIQLVHIGTDEELVNVDQAITELIDRGFCERRPDLDRQGMAEVDQPIGLASLGWTRRFTR